MDFELPSPHPAAARLPNRNKRGLPRTDTHQEVFDPHSRVSRHIGYHPIKAIGDLSNSRRCPLSLGASRSRFRPSSAFGELKSSVNLGHLVGLGLGETGVVRCASDAATSAPRTSSRCGWWIDDAARVVMVIGNEKRTSGRVEMVPLYAARIEDLGPGSFVKLDCPACGHTALLTPASLARLGLEPRQRVLDLKDRARCRGCGVRGRAVVSVKWERMPRR
jgi:hypothetical protein